MLTALLIFPCFATLWVLICDWLGLIEGQNAEFSLPH